MLYYLIILILGVLVGRKREIDKRGKGSDSRFHVSGKRGEWEENTRKGKFEHPILLLIKEE